jgi:hypothetical protein
VFVKVDRSLSTMQISERQFEGREIVGDSSQEICFVLILEEFPEYDMEILLLYI